MTIQQDLKEFQTDLVAQLTQDVGHLQTEKVQLLSDIAQLRQQKQALESQTHLSLSQQQLAQQQIWAKQLAQALATRLYLLLSDKLQNPQGYDRHSIHTATTASRYAVSAQAQTLETERSLTSLDTAVNQTLSSLKHDLDSYQSSINQQLSRMQSLENQGEAILDALVSRLNQQLQTISASPTYAPPHGDGASGLHPQLPPLHSTAQGAAVNSEGRFNNGFPQAAPAFNGSVPNPSSSYDTTVGGSGSFFPAGEASRPVPPQPAQPAATGQPPTPPADPVHYAQKRAPKPNVFRQKLATIPAFQKGLILILLSTVALSLHNVVVQIIGNESSVFNIWRLGGYISLMSLDSSLMILWLRMLVVMPLMAAIATTLHPSTWGDIKQFALSRDRKQLRNVVSSGFFLFLSQVFIYIAIGQVGAGVAVTILFMYPIFTVPLAWWLFNDRPTSLRILVMIGIFAGVVCTFLPKLVTTNQVSMLGIGMAVFAGLAFACYLISMQLSFKKLHPVPVSVIQFFTIFSLTSIILLMRPAQVVPSNPIGLVIGGIVLGTLTLMGYLCNNLGVRFMGAARASIVASSGPVLTALLAFLIIPGEKTRLEAIQIFGIFIVTAGVTALSLERMISQRRLAQKKAQEIKEFQRHPSQQPSSQQPPSQQPPSQQPPSQQPSSQQPPSV